MNRVKKENILKLKRYLTSLTGNKAVKTDLPDNDTKRTTRGTK
jgi:hypothetical protein